MAVDVLCPGCEKRFRVGERHIGRRGACPDCGASVAITAPAKLSSAKESRTDSARRSTSVLTIERLHAACDGPIRKPRATITYRLALVAATLAVLLTPVVYVGLIAAVGYGVYFHTMNHGWIVGTVRGRAVVLVALVYVAPIVAGVTLILFMLKTLLPRPRRESRSRSVVRQNEPLLFAFVDLVCDAVRAPKPKQINIDCQTNASASFRRGLASFLGRDLVLTIGMPLVAGLTVRQIGGVLAHEFGHFGQGAGMRLTYALRSVSGWLYRAANERDAWDDQLAATAADADVRIGWILYLAIGMIWLARKILQGLFWISLAVASYALRQMEFDADRHETRFAGSDCFRSTSRAMARLSASTELAYQQLRGARNSTELVDDLPALIALNESRLDDDLTNQIDQSLTTGQSGWFDTHPTSRDRIAASDREAAPGVFSLDAPASQLFSDFSAQCKATTWEHYRVLLGVAVDRDSLKPVMAVEKELDADVDAARGLADYTLGVWQPARRLGLPRDVLTPAESAKSTAEALRSLRAEFIAAAEKNRALPAEWQAHVQRRMRAEGFLQMHRVNHKFGRDQLEAGFADEAACRQTIQSAQQDAARLDAGLAPLEALLAERLAHSLRLLLRPSIARQIPEGERLARRARRLVQAFQAIEGQLDTINRLEAEQVQLSALLAALQQGASQETVVRAIERVAGRAHPSLSQVRDVLAITRSPYAESGEPRTLADEVVPNLPPASDLRSTVDAIATAVRVGFSIQTRHFTELSSIAARIEAALKLPIASSPQRVEK